MSGPGEARGSSAAAGYRLVRPAAGPPGRIPGSGLGAGLRSGLDAGQQAVVDHPGGPLLVLAGPGTGKTTTLVEAAAARVAAGADPESRLRLTVTPRAATQLRER